MHTPFHWQPLGRLFDPDAQPILGRKMAYSQSPQAMEIDGHIRVFFTSRIADTPKTFLSKPAYADFDSGFTKLLAVANHAILEDAPLGAFDEHGIFPFSPTVHEGAIFAYTTGWSRRVSVSVETGIGLVKSLNGGNSFTRVGTGPVLTTSIHEPYLVCDAFVRHFQGRFHMWYIYGTKWQHYPGSEQPERTYKIGHAVSDDGIGWLKDTPSSLIPDVLGMEESQALPSVVFHRGIYHMVFCYRETTGFRNIASRGYRLGYAWSDNLETWHRDDALLNVQSQGDWDNETMSYPNFFLQGNTLYLLYCGNQFGRYGFGAFRLLD